MADDEKQQGPKDANKDEDSNLAPEKRLEKALASRWDPNKLSQFMRASDGSRAQRLDYMQRSRFEKRFGVDLGDVRIYTGTLAEEITKAHGAEALTVGDTGIILMRQSAKFAEGSKAYTALLAHELTHVAQARPDAISRKETEASQADVGHSEAEAQRHEKDVMREEHNLMEANAKSEGDKAKAAKAKKDKLLALVVEIHEREEQATRDRTGSPARDIL